MYSRVEYIIFVAKERKNIEIQGVLAGIVTFQ